MSIKKLLSSLFMVFIATVLSAAEPETNPQSTSPDQTAATTPAESAEPVIPKRELKFDVSEAEESLPLDKVQEGMLDQRYVATFKLVFVKKDKPAESPQQDSEQQAMQGRGVPRINVIGWADSQSLFTTIHLGEPFREVMTNAISRRFQEFSVFQQDLVMKSSGFNKNLNGQSSLFEAASVEARLSKEIVKAFAVQNTPFIEHSISNDKSGMPAFVQIRLLSPTVEESKKWVEAWLTIYDWGVCYPAQKECLNLKKKIEQILVEKTDALKKAEAELSNLKQEEDKYKNYEDINPEAILTLTTQRRLLSVDLAGINARIKACQEMLAKRSIPDARKDQIETTLVAAQIELRGLDAKQEEIENIIKGAQSRQELLKKTRKLDYSIQILKSSADAARQLIVRIAEYQLGYYPLAVEDGEITIKRIKWVSPSKPASSKPRSSSAPQ
jgi:hypothetical protein